MVGSSLSIMLRSIYIYTPRDLYSFMFYNRNINDNVRVIKIERFGNYRICEDIDHSLTKALHKCI